MLEFTDRRLARPNTNEPLLAKVNVPRLALMGTETDEANTIATRRTTAMYGERVDVYSRNDDYAQVRLKDDHYTAG